MKTGVNHEVFFFFFMIYIYTLSNHQPHVKNVLMFYTLVIEVNTDRADIIARKALRVFSRYSEKKNPTKLTGKTL